MMEFNVDSGRVTIITKGINMTQRRAARAVMLTPEKRVLLMQAQEPSGEFKIWYTPGGGFESDEDAETCLNREIREETGLKHINMGPMIWHRHHKFDWGNDVYDQHEDFYLIPVEQFEPDMRSNPSEIELNSFVYATPTP